MDTLVKTVTVFIFAVILYAMIDFIKGKLQTDLSLSNISPTIHYFVCKFGIYEALNIFVSLFIASWFAEKIIRYLG